MLGPSPGNVGALGCVAPSMPGPHGRTLARCSQDMGGAAAGLRETYVRELP
jgi:hypothetical protein